MPSPVPTDSAPNFQFPPQAVIQRASLCEHGNSAHVEATKVDAPLWSASTYASAVPGVVVAIAGFWVVHRLARRRDREKRVMDMSADAHELAGKAASAAIAGWTAGKGPKRKSQIDEAIHLFQILGSTVTRLRDATARVSRRKWLGACWEARSLKLLGSKHTLELSSELSAFRKLAIQDPFGDPDRGPDHDRSADIRVELGNFVYALDQAITRCLP